MKTVLPKTADRCMGECCESFSLIVAGGPVTLARAREIAWEVRAGTFRQKVAPEDLAELEEMLTRAIPIPGEEFELRCKDFDMVARKCSTYERRPDVCRRYGVKSPCKHPDCQWKDSAREEQQLTRGTDGG